jgi:hypothetical protein
MKRITRVRWSAEERAAVVRRAQTLLAEDPKTTLVSLFTRCQDCLPNERHRPGNPNARSWLQSEIKRAGPLPSPVKTWRPEPSAASPERATTPPDADAARAAAAPRTGAGSDRSPVVSLLIDTGIEILTGILADHRVRAAFAGLLEQAAGRNPPPAGESEGGAPNGSGKSDEGAEVAKRELVVVAGCSAEEAESLAKELKGMLPVTFWASDEPRERLLGLLPNAEIVIGVANGLPQAIESSLARLGTRYVRHTGGVQALYRRLAEHALGT